jgi:chorismate dehydratase
MTKQLSIKTGPTVRLGAISFVNTVPIYSDFHADETVSLIYDVPARLNSRILADELDISPVSSACYLRHQEALVLLDDLSVSSPGAVESVLFLSRQPWGKNLLDLPVFSVPNDSETSVALLAYLLQEATGQSLQSSFKVYEASDYEQALAETGNALIIGDKALLVKEKLQENILSQDVPSHFQNLHCYDLSSLWREKTGLPFVFAVWTARRDWAEAEPECLRAINEALCQARNRFFDQPSIFQRGLHLAQQRSHLPLSTLERYFRHCLSYELTPAHRQSLQRFEAVLPSPLNSTDPPLLLQSECLPVISNWEFEILER